MKRLLSLVLVLTLLLTSGALAYLDPATGTSEHTHHWVTTDTRPATCTESGVRFEYCDLCFMQRQTTIPPLGHYFPNPWKTVQEPTCTAAGHEVNTCQRINYGEKCGFEWWRDIPALGHDWGEWHIVKEAKPGEPGMEQRECKRCGAIEQREYTVEDGASGADALTVKAEIWSGEYVVYDSGDVAELRCRVTNSGDTPLVIDSVLMGAPQDPDNQTKTAPFDHTLYPGDFEYVMFYYTLTDKDKEAGYAILSFIAFGHDAEASDSGSVKSNQAQVVLNLDSFGDYSLIVEKIESSKPANGAYYVEGEVIEYVITVTGRFHSIYTDISVYDYPYCDPNAGYQLAFYPILEPYQTVTITGVSHTVTALDCEVGYFINEAVADSPEVNGSSSSVKSPCGGSPLATLTKSEMSIPANAAYYTSGETITYTVNFANTSDQPLYNVVVYDEEVEETKYELTYDLGMTSVLQPGESVSYTVTHIVTDADCMLGYYTNQAYADFDKEDILPSEQSESTMQIVSNTVKSPCGGYNENAIHLEAMLDDWTSDDVVVYCELTNNSDVPVCPEYVWYVTPSGKTDSISEPSGGAYIPVGDKFSYFMNYTIDAEDVALGYPIMLEFHARCRPEDHPEKSVYSNTSEVELDKDVGDMELYIVKTETSTPANGSFYVDGETITYLIEVWNCQDYELYDVDVYELPNNNEDVKELLDHLDTLAPHVGVSYPASHTVDTDDVNEGEWLNGAKAAWYSGSGDAEDPEVEKNELRAQPVYSPCGKNEGEVTVRKEVVSSPANGKYYVEGEEVRYRVTVTNNTNERIPGLGLSDALEPIYGFNPDLPDWPVFDPGVTCYTEYSYTVTHDDALMGWLVNCARITCMDSNGNVFRFWSNSVEVPTGIDEDHEDNVLLIKREVSTPANGYAYEVGEQVIYEVTITNNYHTVVSNVTITDPLMGEGEEGVIGKIDVLYLTESYSYLYVYTVTKEDAEVGYVLNQAHAIWTDGRTQETHITDSNIVTVPVVPPIPPQPRYDVILTKYVVNPPANGSYYVEGEKITYGIYFTNYSTEPVANVIIFDNLYNTNWVGDNKVGGVFTVQPDESSPTVFFEYIVKDTDVDAGYVFNQACAFWSPLDVPADEGSSVWSNTITVPTGRDGDPDEITYQFSKKVVSSSADPNFYAEGETIDYLITFVNPTDYPMYIDHAWDDLSNNYRFIWNGDLGGGSVPPHSTFTWTYSYTVTKEDAESGSVTNFVQLDLYTSVTDDDDCLYFTPWDYVTVKTGVNPTPPDPTPRTYPVAVKYETSHPANWAYYVEGEDIEYDIVVLNFTGRKFTDLNGYDILLDTPGFIWGPLGDLDTVPVTFHVVYKVTETDVILKSVLNFAWITMYDEEYGEYITVYTDDVVVPTDGTEPPVRRKGRTVCDYTLTASGEGVDELMNVYCSEHAAVHAAQAKLLEEAKTDAAKSSAYEMAVTLWQRALDSEYERLIANSEGDRKTAFENDQNVFAAYILAYKARLEAQGLDVNGVNALIADALCDRVCELCYTSGTAPEARKDVKTEDTPAIERRAAAECTWAFDSANAAYFTKSLNVCDMHMPMVKAISRLFAAAGEDKNVVSIAWDKAAAYWQANLDGQYEALKKEADGELKYALTVERAAYLAVVKTRAALYETYYPDCAPVKELTTRMIEEKALSLCN